MLLFQPSHLRLLLISFYGRTVPPSSKIYKKILWKREFEQTILILFGLVSAATKAAHKKGTLVPMLKKAGAIKDKEEEARKIEVEAAKDVEEDTKSALPTKDIVV